jgi:hypothetical protein
MYATPIDDETVLVASPACAVHLLLTSASVDPGSSTQAAAASLRNTLTTGNTGLDDIACQLEELGYGVYRLPAIIDPHEVWMITYNNVLMERRDGRLIVYMPIYRVPVLDAAAASAYASLGFEVRTIDVSRIYRDGGAIRCLVNVTARRLADASGVDAELSAPHAWEANQAVEFRGSLIADLPQRVHSAERPALGLVLRRQAVEVTREIPVRIVRAANVVMPPAPGMRTPRAELGADPGHRVVARLESALHLDLD